MPSVTDNVARIAKYYAAQASYYHEGTYGADCNTIDYGRLKSLYQNTFADHVVLEIAAGTGYWTELLATTAASVLATDVNPELVDLARGRLGHLPNVGIQVADAYTLAGVSEGFSAAFAHYWWSHIPRKRWRAFLDTLHDKLLPGAVVLFADNLVYHGDWVKRRVDEHGDTYEERQVRDGSRHETIKNFPSPAEITQLLEGVAEGISYVEHEPEHLWTVTYRVRL